MYIYLAQQKKSESKTHQGILIKSNEDEQSPLRSAEKVWRYRMNHAPICPRACHSLAKLSRSNAPRWLRNYSGLGARPR